MMDPDAPLYQRLGGYDAIAAFVDDLLPRLLNDARIGVYWKGKCKDSLRKDRQLIVDFLCSAFGGPVQYLGRDMKTSHDGLEISEADWMAFEEHVVATLKNLGVSGREYDEVMAATVSLKGDVVASAGVVSV
jgi:hemoglobin